MLCVYCSSIFATQSTSQGCCKTYPWSPSAKCSDLVTKSSDKVNTNNCWLKGSSLTRAGISKVMFFNHRMAWVEEDHNAHPVPTPCCVRVANQQTRLPRATSSLALDACRDGASTASLGNLFQCLTTLCVKNLLLISNLSL